MVTLKVRSALQNFASATAIGTAIGVAGVAISENIIQNMTLLNVKNRITHVNVTKAAALFSDVDGVNTPI